MVHFGLKFELSETFLRPCGLDLGALDFEIAPRVIHR